MSGHSKFANIKHKKERNDAAKGKIFTVIGREIAVAVKEGGSDPANNSRLRDVIAKAKANNMPNDTIDRGIKLCQLRESYIRGIWSEWRRYHRRYPDRQQEPYRSECPQRIYQGRRKRRYSGQRVLHV